MVMFLGAARHKERSIARAAHTSNPPSHRAFPSPAPLLATNPRYFSSFRTLGTHLSRKISRNPSRINSFRTLAKTTEGYSCFPVHFPISLFHLRLPSLFSGACRLFVSPEKLKSRRISNLQPLFPKHPVPGPSKNSTNRIKHIQPLFRTPAWSVPLERPSASVPKGSHVDRSCATFPFVRFRGCRYETQEASCFAISPSRRAFPFHHPGCHGTGLGQGQDRKIAAPSRMGHREARWALRRDLRGLSRVERQKARGADHSRNFWYDRLGAGFGRSGRRGRIHRGRPGFALRHGPQWRTQLRFSAR